MTGKHLQKMQGQGQGSVMDTYPSIKSLVGEDGDRDGLEQWVAIK